MRETIILHVTILEDEPNFRIKSAEIAAGGKIFKSHVTQLLNGP